MKRIIYLILLTLSWPSVAWAQCGYGVDAGGGNCVPGTGISGSPFNHYDDNNAPPPAPRAIWADRWGAFAYDNTGILGTSKSRKTKSEAEQAAIQYCAGAGGKRCLVFFTYHNQCAALSHATGENQGGTSAGAPNVEQAKQNAQNQCSSYTGHTCEIIYSGCSYPERIQ